MLALGGGVRGRGPLGQGAKLGLQRLVLLFVFEKKPSGVKTEEKDAKRRVFPFFRTLGQDPRRRLSRPERVPWSARTGGERRSRSRG